MRKNFWLVKSEPDDYSFEQLRKDGSIGWTGVRNYQARNYMRDQMKLGDGVLFYHSNAEPPAIMGIAEVSKESHPDPTQFDSKSDYYDAKSKKDSPTWMMVDIKFVEAFKRPLTLPELKKAKGLEKMLLLRKGQRLSVMPVSSEEWKRVLALAGNEA
ncbi:MAG TPA: EVE domain-containing protein [Planctomycetota bacterium]|nr:EVE domain-containing protein [Planctomycetota bacterium]